MYILGGSSHNLSKVLYIPCFLCGISRLNPLVTWVKTYNTIRGMSHQVDVNMLITFISWDMIPIIIYIMCIITHMCIYIYSYTNIYILYSFTMFYILYIIYNYKSTFCPFNGRCTSITSRLHFFGGPWHLASGRYQGGFWAQRAARDLRHCEVEAV